MATIRHLLVPVLTLCLLTRLCSADISIGYITQPRPQGTPLDALVDGGLRNVSAGGHHVLPLLKVVPQRDPVAAAAAVCSLADDGVAAIVDGGQSPGCADYGVPCISVRGPPAKYGPEHGTLTIRMEPETDAIAEATAGLLREMRWFTFSLVYDNTDHLALLEPVLSDTSFRVTLVRLQGRHSYTSTAQVLAKTRGSRVVLALETPHLLGLLSTCSATVRRPLQVLVATAHTRSEDLESASSSMPIMGVRIGGTPPAHNPHPHGHNLEESLLLDAVETVDRALQQRAGDGARPLQTEVGLCKEGRKWGQGDDLFESLTQVRFDGRSGPVSFSAEGFRTDFSVSVVRFSGGETSAVLRWTPRRGPQDPTLSSDPTGAVRGRSPRDLRTITGGRTPTLRVAAVLSAPYIMLKEQGDNDTEELFGNDRYEGFSVDLMDEIAQEIGFNYILDINSIYGTQDPQTGEFNGVVGDLVNQRVDAVIGDITVNENRQAVVDFTDPWYSFGIALMVYHTGPQSPGIKDLIFMDVFFFDVWLVLLAAAIGTAILLFFLSRVSPYERVGPVDQDAQTWTPFTCCYSTWFTFGSCFRQFIFFQPRAPSTRLLALAWWLLVIVVAAHYVASLSAYFTVAGLRSVFSIKSVYDLPDQNHLTYSSLYGGSTWAFFRDSQSESLQRVYSVMYNRASERRILSSAQGVEEVLSSEGSFGFLMEEPSLEYITERNCALKQLGGPVGSSDYAIALQQDSPYLDYFNDALYAIRESGQLQALRTLWWRNRRGGGSCPSRFLSTEPEPLGSVSLGTLAGPLILLAVGAGVALLLALLECCYYSAVSASAKGSGVGSEMTQQLSQAFTTSPSSHLPLTRQARL